MTTDQATDQHTPVPGLCIAWWNTGLSPTRDPKRAQETDFQTAAAVLTHLIETARADVIVLGEMSEYSLAELRKCCTDGATGPYGWTPAFHPAGRSHFSMCLLSRTDRLEIEEVKPITEKRHGSVIKVGMQFSGRPRQGDHRLHVIASHWPSRLHLDRRDPERTHIAAFLRRWIDDRILDFDAKANVVLLGDYNDEPFDEGMERHLCASRDRGKVLRNPSLFYNPFWRHLNRFPPSPAEASQCDAGSYFHHGDRFSHWHTFDQLIVSSALLFGRSGWRLDEAHTRVATVPRLEGDKQLPHGLFDHLPIIGHLDRHPS